MTRIKREQIEGMATASAVMVGVMVRGATATEAMATGVIMIEATIKEVMVIEVMVTGNVEAMEVTITIMAHSSLIIP